MTTLITPAAATLYTEGHPALNNGRTEIAFVLDNVADWQTLAAGVPTGFEVVVLDSRGDGLAQMADWLAQKAPGSVDAIHLLGHGSSARLDLGMTQLTIDNLGQHMATLARIGTSLAAQGEMLLYACDLAQGTIGERFVQALEIATAHRIAAASHKVGHALHGGDWTLDVVAMPMQTPSLKVHAWSGILAPTLLPAQSTPSDNSTTTDGAANIVLKFSENVNNDRDLGAKIDIYASNGVLIESFTANSSNSFLGSNSGSGSISTITIGTITLNPGSDLSAGGYYVHIYALAGKTGLRVPGFFGASVVSVQDTTTYNFTVGVPNAAPVIGGLTTTTTINDTATATPFSNVTLTDTDNVTVSVSLDAAAKGVFTAASLTASGFTSAGGGVYNLATTTAALAQAAIRQLVFDPSDNRVAPVATEMTTFTISVNDGVNTAVTNNTTTVTSTSVNDTPTDIALSGSSASIYDGSNATLGSLSSTDVDTGNTFTYTLVSGTGATNNASFNISGNSLRVADPATLGAGTYSVRVRTTDAGNLTFEKVFAATVNADLTVTVTAIDTNAPSTYSADVADGGGLDLREALSHVNQSTGNATVNFAPTLAGTITLGSAYTVRDGVSLAMDSDTDGRTLTITGQQFSLGAAFGTSVATGDVLTINSTLSGSSTLTKSGAGKLTLGSTSNATSHTGTTVVNAGTLEVASDSRLGSGAVTLNGGTLGLANVDGTVDNAITLGASGGTVLVANSAAALTGVISGSGTLTKTGSQNLTLSGVNTYSGGTTVTGKLIISNANQVGSGAITLNGGTLAPSLSISSTTGMTNALVIGAGGGTLDASFGMVFSGALSGNGSWAKLGSNTLQFNGSTVTSSGAVDVQAGALFVDGVTGSANAFGTGTVTLASGTTFGLAGSDLTASNNFVLAGNATIVSGTAGGTRTFSGVISETGGSRNLTLSASSAADTRFIFSGNNTYTGTTTIADAGGVVIAGSNTAFSSGAITLNQNGKIGVANGITVANNIALGGTGAQVFADTGNSGTFSGVISGPQALSKAGAGTVTLSGTNTYTGATTVSAGTLALSGGSAIANASAVTVASGASLQLNASETVGSLAGAGNVALGSNTLTAGGNDTSTSATGAISGTGSLVKGGTGTFTLSGTNTYSGSTTVAAGTLDLTGSVAGDVSVSSGGTLAGTGTAGGSTGVASGGTLSPGGGRPAGLHLILRLRWRRALR